jgi:hypothetical protein
MSIVASVVYKKKYGKKVYIETYDNIYLVDNLLGLKSKKIPPNVEILEIGVGKSFEARYKAKYWKKK